MSNQTEYEVEHAPAPGISLADHWDEVGESLEWFTEQMIDKFESVDHKGHWRYVGWQYLYNRLCAEMEELSRSLDKNPGMFSADDAIGECVDVANCAMMLADWLRKR